MTHYADDPVGYTGFAQVYDRLMADARYAERAAYLLHLFEQFGTRPATVLDLACGTGTLSLLMAEAGLDVIGVDASSEMLTFAADKAAKTGRDILFLCQDMTALHLHGPVDGAVCVLDSVNHLVNAEALSRAFERLRLFLEPGALFLFDANTPYKHRAVLGNNTFVFEEDGVFCTWQNRTDSHTLVTDITLDFFIHRGGQYERQSDAFQERGYSRSQLETMLSNAGLETLAVYGDLTEEPPKEECQRMVFVSRRPI